MFNSWDEDEDEDDDYYSNILIDNGSYMIKAGWAGDDAPRAVFPNLITRGYKNDVYVGDDALSKRSNFRVTSAMNKGIVHNWDDMQQVWHHTFYNEQRIAPEEHDQIILFHPFQPKNDKKKLIQIMFEIFNIPGLYYDNTSVTSLYSNGLLSGIVLVLD